MTVRRTLGLKRETLAELTADDLRAVVGGVSGLEECSLPTGVTRGCTYDCTGTDCTATSCVTCPRP